MSEVFPELTRDSILFEDERLLVIDKPPQLLVHRSKDSSRSEPAVLQMARELCGGQHVYAVHRLDRATSGVLVLAKSSEVASLLAQQFQSREVTKEYWAVVRGWPADQRIDSPLRNLDKPEAPVQEAQTELRVKGHLELPIANDRHPQSRYAWLSLWPETGRQHQLRRHMLHIRNPIIGDTTYGHGVHNRIFRDHLNCSRMLLHHVALEMKHPDGSMVRWEAPVRGVMADVLARF